MKYAVWRTGIKSSNHWPMVVECKEGTSAEGIVAECFRVNGWPDYEPRDKSYIVVPMDRAMIVSYVPKRQYDIHVERYPG